jgi:hypothetical protein
MGRRILFHDKIPDPGKHMWNNILACLAEDPSGKQLLANKDTTVGNLARGLVRYPSMFHFNADGPIACLLKYPAVIEPEDRDFLYQGHQRAVLTTRGSYNLFTGEGTENHIAMCRFSGYLYCQEWLKDHPDDQRAKNGLELCRQYILRHARDVYGAGTGEFNTSTYLGYHMRGVFTCFDHAEDAAVKAACRAMLDYYAAELCLKYVNGINAGPECRGMAKRSCGSDCDRIVWLWFGDSPVQPEQQSNAVYAALSEYRPPEVLRKITTKAVMSHAQYFNSHPTYLLDEPGHSRETLYFGPTYALGCLYMPNVGLTGASAQFCPMKLVSRSGGGGSAWVMFGNSNTATRNGGSRGPFDQWAQHKNVLIQLTRVPADAAEMIAAANKISEEWGRRWQQSYQRRWRVHPGRNIVTKMSPRTSGIDSYLAYPVTEAVYGKVEKLDDDKSGVVFLRHAETYVAVRSLKGKMPRVTDDYGMTARELKKSKMEGWQWLIDPVGDQGIGGFVVEVGCKADHGSFEEFRSAISRKTRLDRSKLESDLQVTYTNLQGEKIVARFGTKAQRQLIEPLYDWGYIVAEEQDIPRPVPTKPPFAQPTYPGPGKGLESWGRIPSVTVNGEPIGGEGFLDLAAAWPVFKGPHVNLDGRVLTITDGQKTYRVDYSRGAPAWTEK